MRARLIRPQRDDQGAELARWRRLFTWSAVLTAPVFLVAMVLPWLPGLEPILEAHVLGFPLDELVKWALVTPVQFCIGWRFHAGAWNALRNGRRARPCLSAHAPPACPPTSALSKPYL